MSEPGAAAPKTITIRQGDEYRAKEGSIYIANDISTRIFPKLHESLEKFFAILIATWRTLTKKSLISHRLIPALCWGIPIILLLSAQSVGMGKRAPW